VEELALPEEKIKRYAGGRDQRGQIPNRRPLSERAFSVMNFKNSGFKL